MTKYLLSIINHTSFPLFCTLTHEKKNIYVAAQIYLKRDLLFSSGRIFRSLKGVNKALISHGHSDHARWGSKHYITNEINVPIIKHRLGSISVSGKKYGESFNINGVKFSFHPAGHVPGSSQIRVEYRGEVWVFTGDYKTQKDGISSPFEPIKCNTFITECTFGLPVFQWEEPKYIHAKINDWWAKNQSENHKFVDGLFSWKNSTPTKTY